MDEYVSMIKPFLTVLQKREGERKAAAHILRMGNAVNKFRHGTGVTMLAEVAALQDSGEAWSEVRPRRCTCIDDIICVCDCLFVCMCVCMCVCDAVRACARARVCVRFVAILPGSLPLVICYDAVPKCVRVPPDVRRRARSI